MNKKIKGKLTKCAIVKRMWARAISGQTTNKYNLKYVARRINVTPSYCKYVIGWMVKRHMIIAEVVGANIVFSF